MVAVRQRARRSVAMNQKKSRKGGTRQIKTNEKLSMKERRQVIQLVTCGSVFVLFVAVKLLLPGRIAVFSEKLSGALTKSVDVQTVFSVVGQAFMDDESAEEIYQSVFQAEGDVEHQPEVQIPKSDSALDELQLYRQKADLELEGEKQLDSVTEAENEASTLSYVLYSKDNLPEDVNLEQSILNFDYCVPVSGTLSSNFGYREHPTEGESRFHYGIDLAADTGTNIQCFADGTVTAVGESSSYGKYCVVSHNGGYSTLYAHCNRIKVSSGAAVKMGDIIAEVGETGIATGPHLHFELQQDGTYLNPIYYMTGL